MATFNKDITLIAGSGNFAFEAAKIIEKKKKLRNIILISDNVLIQKRYKELVKKFNIKDLEEIIKFIKKYLIKVLILGYVNLPPIKDIKLSISSKLYLSKDFFFNDINSQSKILKKFIESKNIKLISQKYIFKDNLVFKSDQIIKKDHKKIHQTIQKNFKIIKKIFSMNLTQSFIMDGNRIISIEDIFGTNYMINKISKSNFNFNNLVLVKSIKKDQIFEIDYPIIGNETLTLLKRNFKAICLINKGIIISQKKFLCKIFLVNLSLIVI